MNKKISKKNIIIGLTIVFLATAIIAVAIIYRLTVSKSNTKLSPKDNSMQPASQNLSAQDEKINSKNQTTQYKMSQNLAKPILNKSSGNNGPVPIGISINFVCQSSEGDSCDIELKNKNGNIINLGYQPFKNNGKDQYYADWYWTSAEGDWTIVARLKNNQGEVSESDPQNLSVK